MASVPQHIHLRAALAELQAADRMHQLQLAEGLPALHIEAWAQREAASALSELCLICVSVRV